MTFLNYFHQMVEYPNDITENILPVNTLYNYISHTFLNGFINYVKPLKVILCERYLNNDEILNNLQMYNKEGVLDNFSGTKEEIYNIAKEPGRIFHFNMRMFEDDIIILSKSSNGKYFWYFWFDMDCSDCSIGRFETKDSDEIVLESFNKHLEHVNIGNFKELPLFLFNGWTKF